MEDDDASIYPTALNHHHFYYQAATLSGIQRRRQLITHRILVVGFLVPEFSIDLRLVRLELELCDCIQQIFKDRRLVSRCQEP